MQTLTAENIEQFNKYIDLVAENPFPIRRYTEEAINNDYNSLKTKEHSELSNTGLQIVESFHPSIWRCNVKDCLSPMDAWNDLEIMAKVILNRFKYLQTTDLDLIKIRAGLTISKIAPKVSIFRPSLAKYLINKYLGKYSTVFDPCSGFSGRMLGTCCLGKEYLGQDVNSTTIKESNDLIKALGLESKVIYKNSIYDKGEYECLFTCPPYGDKEIWHQDIEVLSADEWIETCLQNFKCQSYLFVVDNTEKYKNFIVEEIRNKSHFGSNFEKVVLVNKNIT